MKKICIMVLGMLLVSGVFAQQLTSTQIFSQEVYYTSFGYIDIHQVETITVVDPLFSSEEVVIKFYDGTKLIKKHIKSDSTLAEAYNADLVNDYLNLKKELEALRRLIRIEQPMYSYK